MRRITAILGSMLVLTIGAALLLPSGCDNKTTESEPVVIDTLDLPPQSSFIMDFGDFGSSQVSVGGEDQHSKLMGKGYFLYSAGNVFVWQTLLAVRLVVPTVAFVNAFNHHPVLQADGWWQWSYNVVAAGYNHTVELKGKIVGDEVQWEMWVSRHGEWEDFLWYTGTHNLTATAGNWTIYKSHDEPTTTFMSIDWLRDPDDETGELTYTILDEFHDLYRCYIYYGSTLADSYDRFYHIFDYGEENLTEIEWNYDTKAGRVKDTAYYHDTTWHCWDSDLEDTDCP